MRFWGQLGLSFVPKSLQHRVLEASWAVLGSLGRLGALFGRLSGAVCKASGAVLGRWRPPCRDAWAVQAGSGNLEKASRAALKNVPESRGPIYYEETRLNPCILNMHAFSFICLSTSRGNVLSCGFLVHTSQYEQKYSNFFHNMYHVDKLGVQRRV